MRGEMCWMGPVLGLVRGRRRSKSTEVEDAKPLDDGIIPKSPRQPLWQ